MGEPVSAPVTLSADGTNPLVRRVSSPGLDVEVHLDRTYTIDIDSDYIAIHDSRLSFSSKDPISWNGSFFVLRTPALGCAPSLELYTDRLGTVPLYYAWKGDTLFFSSNLVRLSSAGFRALDTIGAWELLLFNQPLWSRSLLRDVSLAPPASRMVVTGDQALSMGRYWSPPAPSDAPALDEDKAVDSLIEHLRAAHGRALPTSSAIAFPVTGGLDSRINLAVHADRWDRGFFFHASFDGGSEAPIARRLAREFGLCLHEYSGEESWRCLTRLDPTRETGELNAWQWWLQETHRQVAGATPDAVLLDGYLQDVLLNPHIIAAEPMETGIERHLDGARYRSQRAGNQIDAKTLKEILNTFRENFRVDYADGLFMSQRFYMENRSRKYVFGMVRLAQDLMRVAVPGIDSDLLDFSFALPWSMRSGGHLYRQAIGRFSKAMTLVPYDKTGVGLFAVAPKNPLYKTIHRELRYYVKRIAPLLSEAVFRDFSVGKVLRGDRATVVNLKDSIAGSVFLEQLLGDKRGVRRVWSRFCGAHDVLEFVHGLLTIARLEEGIAKVKGQAHVKP